MQIITTLRNKLKRFQQSRRGISTVITVMLSLVLVVIIAGNVFMSSHQMSQIDMSKIQEQLALTNVANAPVSPWFTAQNEYTVNVGSWLSGDYAGTQQAEDGPFETFRQELSSSNASYNPSRYSLNGQTTYGSGTVSDLNSNNGISMNFDSYNSGQAGQTLYAHRETTNIAGTNYNNFLQTSADTSGDTLTAPMTGSRNLLGKFIYPLQGIPTVPASTWTFYYRAWQNGQTSFTLTNSPSSCSGNWNNPTNAYASGGGYAWSSTSGRQESYGGYGFSVPSDATITQVRVRMDAYCTNNDRIRLYVSTNGGSNYLPTYHTQTLTRSLQTYWIDVTDWTTWTPNKINNNQIFARVNHQRSGGTDTVRLDWLPIEVSYTATSTEAGYIDADLLIRRSDGAVRSTVATKIAASANLPSDATTLSATYAWSPYTVESQTDYLEIDYYLNSQSADPSDAYLRIDDNTLPIADQTRIANVILPSEFVAQVEFEGTGNLQTGQNLAWTFDSAFNIASVSTTLQLYNYNNDQYPTSGDGFTAYTSSGTPDTHETKTQLITASPSFYLNSSGGWKMRITGTSSSPFSLSLDWVEYKAVGSNMYLVNIQNSFTIDKEEYPKSALGSVEVLVTYNTSRIDDTWHLKAYDWATSTFSNSGFNPTDPSTPAGTGQWTNYTVTIPASYIATNGTVVLQFHNSGQSASQATMSVDFLGVRAQTSGVLFYLKNSGSSTTHIVALWVTNFTAHNRYKVDFYLNSGEAAALSMQGIDLPSSFVAKAVTERGNIAVFSTN